MKNINTTQTKTSTLRQRAEALLKEHHEKANLTSAEADMLKLIHELKDNQIELELQNENLKSGKSGAQEAIVDITGHKLADDALHEIKFKYDELVRHISVGLYKMRVFPDGKMKFEYVSDKLCKMLGLEEQVALNNPETVFSAIHPEDYPAMVEANRIAAQSPKLFHWEGRCRIWGQMGWIRIESEPTILPDGGSLWNGVIFDITRQKKNELTLQQSEARFRSYFELPLIGIAINSPEKDWIEANDGLKAMLGYSMEELSGLTWEDLTHPDDLAYDVEQFNRVMADQQDTYFLEKRFIHKNGNIIWTNLSVGCVRKPDRSVDYTVALLQNITDRKNSENELRINEERYRLLAENSRDVIWTMKLDGTITYISPAVEQLRGFTVEEAMRQPLDKILTPESQTIVIEYLQRLNTAFESGMPLESFRGENEYYCKDGSTLWTEVIVYPIQANNNDSVTILGVTRDNTERRKAENALRKSEEMLRETGRMAKLGGWELDLTTMELNWTEETYRIHEVEPHQKPLLEEGINFYTPESRPVLQKALDLAIKQGVPFDAELQFITAKGNHLWVRSFGKADLVDGHPVRLFGVFQDITERKKAEQTLQESEQRFRNNMEHVKLISVMLDTDGNITFANNYFLKLTGWQLNEVLGHNWFELFIPPHAQVRKVLFHQIEQGIIPLNYQNDILTRTGEHRLIDWNNTLLRNAQGNIVGIAGIGVDITEQNLAELALKASEEKYKESQLVGNVAHWEYNFVTQKLHWSDQLYRIYGISKNNFEPGIDTAFSSVHCDDQEKLGSQFFHAIQTKLGFENESRIITSQGEIKHIITRAKPRFDESGNPLTMLATIVDITDRKNAEEALAQSRSELKAIYEFSPVMMCLVDANRRIIFANPAFTALTGTPEEQLKGGHACGVFGCINAFDDVRGCGFGNNCRNCSLRLAMDDTLKNGTGHINVEYQTTLLKNGETRKLSLLGSTVLIESNNQRNLLLCLNDITERKLMEEKLIESSTRLVLATRAGHVGIWDYDIVNNILEWDDQMFSLYGITKSQFGGAYEAWLAGVHPDFKTHGETEIQLALNGEKEFDSEFKVLWPDGSVHDIRALAIVVRSNTGKPLRMIGTNWDITRQKKSEEEIKQRNEELHDLNATKDKFFSIIAHDLKSPFNSILGFSEILVEQINKKEYDNIEQYAGIIRQSSQKAFDLLMNLMEWSRSQTGRIEFSPISFDIIESILEITTLFDVIAGQKEITIKSELTPKATVFADLAMINTVLRNLISNAIKFTKPGGEIIMTVTEEKNKLTVAVKDNGIGIAKDRVEKLFGIEASQSSPGTANEKGTGLGLILCKEFVEKNSGKIWVESEDGMGSTFYFTLPYITQPLKETIVRETVPPEKNETVRKLKILIAEDDEVSEQLIDNYIKMFDYEVLKAKTGAEAVEFCRDNTDIDLILMDIRMPVMDGYEATRQIRQFNQKVVIIAQTAHAQLGDRKKAIELGCNDYIAKPMKKTELLAMIKQYFGENTVLTVK